MCKDDRKRKKQSNESSETKPNPLCRKADKEFNMFRIMQTSAVLAITLIMVNESHAGRPGSSSGNGSSKTPPTQATTKLPVNTHPYLPFPGPAPKTPVHFPVNTHPYLPFPNSPTKDPVHGTGSSHDPRSPSQTHGRDYCNWGHHCWNSRYGCEFYCSSDDGCDFYFYAPANCYYPITVIEMFPPVRTPLAVSIP